MAIRVRYFENTRECYTEGPFVMVNANDWRIEVDNGGHCPVLPDPSIYKFLEKQGMPSAKTPNEELCAKTVDFLNAQVAAGVLVKSNCTWIWESEPVQDWYFTFGFGHAHPNCYVKINGTFGSARAEMFKWHGDKWAFQYDAVKALPAIEKYNMKEVELDEPRKVIVLYTIREGKDADEYWNVIAEEVWNRLDESDPWNDIEPSTDLLSGDTFFKSEVEVLDWIKKKGYIVIGTKEAVGY